jgi:hypothetical protein
MQREKIQSTQMARRRVIADVTAKVGDGCVCR